MNNATLRLPLNALRLLTFTRGKRIMAYPKYDPQYPIRRPQSPKDHSSINRLALMLWLGPRNMRGEYYRNKYFYPPQNHRPNYVVPDGQTVVDASYDPEARPRRNLVAANRTPLHPFPLNTATKTSHILSKDLKDKIVYDVETKGLSPHDVAFKYGMKRARVEATLTLEKIRKDMTEKVCFLLILSFFRSYDELNYD